MSQPAVTQTIISPDVIPGPTAPSVVVGRQTVVLVPMDEWKQCAQRGVRSFIQAATYLFGGGSLALFFAGMGIAPDYVAQLPGTGNKALDALIVSLIFGLVCFVWNLIEFALDIDLKAPKWRA